MAGVANCQASSFPMARMYTRVRKWGWFWYRGIILSGHYKTNSNGNSITSVIDHTMYTLADDTLRRYGVGDRAWVGLVGLNPASHHMLLLGRI